MFVVNFAGCFLGLNITIPDVVADIFVFFGTLGVLEVCWEY